MSVLMTELVLSLFPGVGLLDMAFEESGFCVVRGPDALWGGDICTFHPPAVRFDGVVGGPPCQRFSRLAHLTIHRYGESSLAANLIPEFERCVAEAQPQWFLMENVPAAPEPRVVGYVVTSQLLNNRWFGAEQNRVRRFSFGALSAKNGPWRFLEVVALEHANYEYAVLGKWGGLLKNGQRDKSQQSIGRSLRAAKRSLAECARLQGLPEDFLSDAPFTARAKRQIIANGVPLAMGRAVAKAIVSWLGSKE